MHSIPSGPDSLVSLPRQGGIAYHAQESWVLNETIRVRLHISSCCAVLGSLSARTTSYLVHHMTRKDTMLVYFLYVSLN